jgi:hypothetical protein
MVRTQLYNPFADPERPEFFHRRSSVDNDELVFREISISKTNKPTIHKQEKRCVNFKTIAFFKFMSVICRLLMISYSAMLILETAIFFNEQLILLNMLFLVLILADCYIVVCVRKGLEDRWCSLSIFYFICANSIPLWLLEITYSSMLSVNIYNPDFIKFDMDVHFKPYNDSKTILSWVRLENDEIVNSDTWWLDQVNKDRFSFVLELHEVLFCFVLITSRVFLPQANLTWSAISSISEFSFNTILDVYFTMSMCREAKYNLPKSVVVASFVVSNLALLPIALNTFPDNEESTSEGAENKATNFTISSLRHFTDNFYFNFIMQIVFTDLPLLIVRLLIMNNLKYVKNEFYYLIAKQILILFCKLAVMIHNWLQEFLKTYTFEDLLVFNNSDL